MVTKSPKDRVVPLPNGHSWLTSRVTNSLLSGIPSSKWSLSGTTSPFDQILPPWSPNRKKRATKGVRFAWRWCAWLLFVEKHFLVIFQVTGDDDGSRMRVEFITCFWVISLVVCTVDSWLKKYTRDLERSSGGIKKTTWSYEGTFEQWGSDQNPG